MGFAPRTPFGPDALNSQGAARREIPCRKFVVWRRRIGKLQWMGVWGRRPQRGPGAVPLAFRKRINYSDFAISVYDLPNFALMGQSPWSAKPVNSNLSYSNGSDDSRRAAQTPAAAPRLYGLAGVM